MGYGKPKPAVFTYYLVHPMGPWHYNFLFNPLFKPKLKVKLSLCMPWRYRRGAEVQLQSFLTSALMDFNHKRFLLFLKNSASWLTQ
jgi:hypothetical protein